MVRFIPVLLVAAALIAGVCPGRCPAQGPPGYPAPGPAVEAAPPAEPTAEPPAWFVNAELGVLRPRVLFESGIGGRADLDWALSPRVELGYVFGEAGAVRLGYRNLSSHGVSQSPLDLPAPGQGGTETDTTTLDAHWIDVDYVSPVYAPTEHLRLEWEAGPRVVDRFLKLRADASVGELTTSTSFWGVGPYLGTDFWYLCGGEGLALFGHLDAAVTFGTDRAHVTGSLVVPVPGGQQAVGIHESLNRSEAEVDLNAEVGLGWCHSFPASYIRLKAGVQVEGWGLGTNKSSDFFPYRALGTVGPFVRCELGF